MSKIKLFFFENIDAICRMYGFLNMQEFEKYIKVSPGEIEKLKSSTDDNIPQDLLNTISQLFNFDAYVILYSNMSVLFKNTILVRNFIDKLIKETLNGILIWKITKYDPHNETEKQTYDRLNKYGFFKVNALSNKKEIHLDPIYTYTNPYQTPIQNIEFKLYIKGGDLNKTQNEKIIYETDIQRSIDQIVLKPILFKLFNYINIIQQDISLSKDAINIVNEFLDN